MERRSRGEVISLSMPRRMSVIRLLLKSYCSEKKCMAPRTAPRMSASKKRTLLSQYVSRSTIKYVICNFSAYIRRNYYKLAREPTEKPERRAEASLGHLFNTPFSNTTLTTLSNLIKQNGAAHRFHPQPTYSSSSSSSSY